MTVTLPIINGSSGVWGTILNTAITDIDNRLVTATTKNGTQDTALTTLTGRVDTIENTHTVGLLAVSTSATRPPAQVGLIGLETDTGYMYYCASISGSTVRVPFPGSLMARLRQTTTQAIATGAGLAITFGASDTNRQGGFSGSGSRFTAPVAGNYEFTGSVAFASNTTGYRLTAWVLNGNHQNGSRTIVEPVASSAATIINARTQTYPMNAGDYMELWGAHTATASINTEVSGLYQSSMTVKYLGYYGN